MLLAKAESFTRSKMCILRGVELHNMLLKTEIASSFI